MGAPPEVRERGEQLRVLSRARGEGLGHGCGARRGCAAPSSPSAHTQVWAHTRETPAMDGTWQNGDVLVLF